MTKIIEIKQNNQLHPDIKELFNNVREDLANPNIKVNGLAVVLVEGNGNIRSGYEYINTKFEMLGALETLVHNFKTSELE